MTQLTEFGKTVKHALIDQGQTQAWLAGRIEAETGLKVDSGYFYKIFTGERSAPKVVSAIREILNIKEEE